MRVALVHAALCVVSAAALSDPFPEDLIPTKHSVQAPCFVVEHAQDSSMDGEYHAVGFRNDNSRYEWRPNGDVANPRVFYLEGGWLGAYRLDKDDVHMYRYMVATGVAADNTDTCPNGVSLDDVEFTTKNCCSQASAEHGGTMCPMIRACDVSAPPAPLLCASHVCGFLFQDKANKTEIVCGGATPCNDETCCDPATSLSDPFPEDDVPDQNSVQAPCFVVEGALESSMDGEYRAVGFRNNRYEWRRDGDIWNPKVFYLADWLGAYRLNDEGKYMYRYMKGSSGTAYNRDTCPNGVSFHDVEFSTRNCCSQDSGENGGAMCPVVRACDETAPADVSDTPAPLLCASHVCSSGFQEKANKTEIVCGATSCNDETCCDPAASLSDPFPKDDVPTRNSVQAPCFVVEGALESSMDGEYRAVGFRNNRYEWRRDGDLWNPKVFYLADWLGAYRLNDEGKYMYRYMRRSDGAARNSDTCPNGVSFHDVEVSTRNCCSQDSGENGGATCPVIRACDETAPASDTPAPLLCASHVCSSGFQEKANKTEIVCGATSCNDETCCDPAASLSDPFPFDDRPPWYSIQAPCFVVEGALESSMDGEYRAVGFLNNRYEWRLNGDVNDARVFTLNAGLNVYRLNNDAGYMYRYMKAWVGTTNNYDTCPNGVSYHDVEVATRNCCSQNSGEKGGATCPVIRACNTPVTNTPVPVTPAPLLCASHVCSSGFQEKANKTEIVCGATSCNDETCCDPAASLSDPFPKDDVPDQNSIQAPCFVVEGALESSMDGEYRAVGFRNNRYEWRHDGDVQDGRVFTLDAGLSVYRLNNDAGYMYRYMKAWVGTTNNYDTCPNGVSFHDVEVATRNCCSQNSGEKGGATCPVIRACNTPVTVPVTPAPLLCASHVCSSGFQEKANKTEIGCGATSCNDETCCDPAASLSDPFPKDDVPTRNSVQAPCFVVKGALESSMDGEYRAVGFRNNRYEWRRDGDIWNPKVFYLEGGWLGAYRLNNGGSKMYRYMKASTGTAENRATCPDGVSFHDVEASTRNCCSQASGENGGATCPVVRACDVLGTVPVTTALPLCASHVCGPLFQDKANKTDIFCSGATSCTDKTCCDPATSLSDPFPKEDVPDQNSIQAPCFVVEGALESSMDGEYRAVGFRNNRYEWRHDGDVQDGRVLTLDAGLYVYRLNNDAGYMYRYMKAWVGTTNNYDTCPNGVSFHDVEVATRNCCSQNSGEKGGATCPVIRACNAPAPVSPDPRNGAPVTCTLHHCSVGFRIKASRMSIMCEGTPPICTDDTCCEAKVTRSVLEFCRDNWLLFLILFCVLICMSAFGWLIATRLCKDPAPVVGVPATVIGLPKEDP